MVPFSGMITHDGTITFTHSDGRIHSVLASHPKYARVKELLRSMASEPDDSPIRDELLDLAQPVRAIVRSTGGKVTVENGRVMYDGREVRNFLAERILWMLEEDFDAAPMLAFLEKVKENPSNRAVDELYRFMEANKMGITQDGMILAYKRVRGDYLDIYTGTMDNSVGRVVEMIRNEVNDNPHETCSHGLHVCSMAYLPHYGAGSGNRVMICRIHPRDVVSVPVDYHNAKMRVCRYTVIEEVQDTTDILGSKPVFEHEAEEQVEWAWGDDDSDLDEVFVEDFGVAEEEVEPVAVAFTGEVLDFNAELKRVTDTVVRCVEEQLAIKDVEPRHRLDNLGADDLDVIEIVMMVEDELRVELGDDWTDDRTVEDIIDAVLNQL